jgi:hypothetical protein
MNEHPVELVVTDDLRRSRLTVFFRLLLLIPHLIWFIVWTIAVVFAAILGWLGTLATGRLSESFQAFFCSYIRYTTHLTAYVTLVANPYPGFTGEAGAYPIDVRLPGSSPQSRARTFFRLILAIPALIVSLTIGGGGGATSNTTTTKNGSTTDTTSVGLLAVVAVLGWFASLFTGRMPSGLRDAGAYAIGYRAQTLAYLLLVTERYPNADPTALLAGLDPPPRHPVRLVGDSHDLRRSRVLVFFRLPLAIPLLVWLLLWTIVAVLAVILQWFVTLFRGRPAPGLHAFLARYVRYQFRVFAFLTLAANPFPSFTGEPGGYPLDLELPDPGRQNRWKTGFRLILTIPAFFVSAGLGGALLAAAVLTWFAALVKASAPEGLRNLSAYALRYNAQLYAYLYLLTDAYPHASPLEGSDREPVFVEEAPAIQAA